MTEDSRYNWFIEEVMRRQPGATPADAHIPPRGSKRGRPSLADRDKDIVAGYMAGATMEQLGDDYDLTRERIRQILKKHGIVGKAVQEDITATQAEDNFDAVEDLWSQGYTAPEIARTLRIRGSAVAQAVKRVSPEAQRERHMVMRRKQAAAHTISQDRNRRVFIGRLQRLAEELGRTPGIKAYEQKYGYGRSQNLQITFGSWAEACRAAGLTPNPRPRNTGKAAYTEEEIRESFTRITKIVGRYPTVADWDEYHIHGVEISAAALRRRSELYEFSSPTWLGAVSYFASHIEPDGSPA